MSVPKYNIQMFSTLINVLKVSTLLRTQTASGSVVSLLPPLSPVGTLSGR